MYDDSYLMVQWRDDGESLVGDDNDPMRNTRMARWSSDKTKAKRFESQKQFGAWFRDRFGVRYGDAWSTCDIRFVRVRPRKEAA
jgi:hypothetical protein